ncbi:MAG: hypothetical protein HHAS10_05310 [Candidatus Altimarinota bacterium]
MNSFFDEARILDLPLGEYVIFGSGPMVVRGIREGRDIDIIVTHSLFEKLRDKYSKHIHDEKLELGKIELSAKCLDYSDDEILTLISTAELIEGLPFATLDEVIKFKKRLNREKDRVDIELIETYRKSI